MTALGHPPVPKRYRGVWQRTLLQTPTQRDTTTWVRWLQTACHHGDLRVPAADSQSPARPASLAACQGFSGVTQVDQHNGGEVCAWHRQIDLQPPGLHPDAGRILFDGNDRLIETGVHGDYLEIWERLPGSGGRCLVLEEVLDTSANTLAPQPARLLVAGRWLMRLRPRTVGWPADTRPGNTLADVVARNPAAADALLDFEITFGDWHNGLLTIESSTVAALAGTAERCEIRRTSAGEAQVDGPAGTTGWRVLEWA